MFMYYLVIQVDYLNGKGTQDRRWARKWRKHWYQKRVASSSHSLVSTHRFRLCSNLICPWRVTSPLISRRIHFWSGWWSGKRFHMWLADSREEIKSWRQSVGEEEGQGEELSHSGKKLLGPLPLSSILECVQFKNPAFPQHLGLLKLICLHVYDGSLYIVFCSLLITEQIPLPFLKFLTFFFFPILSI